ncbi:MAG: Nramp family divalent metal transporter [Chloracidobacterium sp.]|nr:Nramp family divalent metal transporter [Chloracidobacterium sp.]MCC6825500.1 Nramp family divalent metal transporter [Acidobacteriota bacterium]MCO5333466.1 Nramp family divalent metal transporter [Pyrinomonadaceae bacterium]
MNDANDKKDDGRKHRIEKLGPGLITGAADDDPSGISTYSTAGAAYGFGFLWTMVISVPLMVAVQLMCARIGLVTGRGLGGILRRYYSRKLLLFACSIVLVANTINIAADLGGMAGVAELVTGIGAFWFIPLFTLLILVMLFKFSYAAIAKTFKWLTLVLFAYVIAAFLARPDWSDVLRATVVPRLSFTGDYLMTFVGVFGTTISPYLFFWQASEEIEEKKKEGRIAVGHRVGATKEELDDARDDTVIGMSISSFVAYFIILTTGATLFLNGQHDIQTARQAAEALRPLAGDGAYWLFALGLIGTGLLGVPVLAGSAAYAIAESGAWRGGMDEKPHNAKKFYFVITLSMTIGMCLNYAGLDAIKMLFWSAVLNGVLAPPLIIIILFICNNKKIMGGEVNGKFLNIFGVLAAGVMGFAALAMFWAWIFG